MQANNFVGGIHLPQPNQVVKVESSEDIGR